MPTVTPVAMSLATPTATPIAMPTAMHLAMPTVMPTTIVLLSRQVMLQQYLKEQSQGTSQSLESKYYSKFLQSLAELFVNVQYLERAWGIGRSPERRDTNWALYTQTTHRRVESEDGQVGTLDLLLRLG